MLRDDVGDSPVINLNVPNLELNQIRGWRFTELGPEPPRAMNRVELQPVVDEAGACNGSMSWGDETTQTPEFDAGALMNDEISISYLSRIVALEPPKESSLGSALTDLLKSS